jgi:hypothetical protein
MRVEDNMRYSISRKHCGRPMLVSRVRYEICGCKRTKRGILIGRCTKHKIHMCYTCGYWYTNIGKEV